MTWRDVTVFQWQQLNEIYTGEHDYTANQLETMTLSILLNMTEAEVDSQTEQWRRDKLKEIHFVHEPPKGKPEQYIKVNGRRYRCVYDVRKIRAARYIEAKHFGKKPEENLHRIAASMIVPQRRRWFGWEDAGYEATRHEEYANDLLMAPITAVMGSVVFFCEVYRRWMGSSLDYLAQEMMEKGLTKEEATGVAMDLWRFTDGTIRSLWWRNTSESP